ncbi:MAG: DUF1592 domain-containing protein [Planctomycetota bacterium]
MGKSSVFAICLILLVGLFSFAQEDSSVSKNRSSQSGGSASAVTANESFDFDQRVAPILKQFCGKCHGQGDDLASDINLLELTTKNLDQHSELLQQVIDVLDLDEMPPSDEPQLDSAVRENLIKELRLMLHKQVERKKLFPRAPIRRMNRFQYNNAVVDLFQLKCIVFTLPERMMRDHNRYFRPETGKMPDVVTVGSRPLGKSQMIEPRLAGVAAFPQDLRAENGYDNQGDHLSMSPLLMESFLRLGQSITQSPDFHAKKVGIWQSFFRPPKDVSNLSQVVEDRLKPFLTKAFRRSPEPETVQRYVRYVMARLDSGEPFETAMKEVAAATLASPKFLYLYDISGSEDVSEPIDEFELASRLSFFLWGSVPDQELLLLAKSKQLTDPNVLSQQVDRMLKDRKLKRFCDSFPAQWLQLERIISSSPARDRFPKFYFSKYKTSMHMMLEPLLLFETVLIEDLPVTQLVDSEFTYRSVKLDKAYGELATGKLDGKKKGNDVQQLFFHRLPITDRRNGGVITNAAIMTMTSGPDRSKPITRGAWVAGVIFNNPPEPPPADVPSLEENPPEDEAQLTLRERLDAHRQRADCKGCHEKIDPLGFALENFDAIGNWRDEYANDRKVDMQGELFRKHEFNDVVEFKDAILNEKLRFTRGLAAHLLSFGLARALGPADQFALDEIVEQTAEDDYKMKTLIKQIVLSEPFLRR